MAKFEDLKIGDIFVGEKGSIVQKTVKLGSNNALIIAPPEGRGSFIQAGHTTWWPLDDEVLKVTSITVEAEKVVPHRERRTF